MDRRRFILVSVAAGAGLSGGLRVPARAASEYDPPTYSGGAEGTAIVPWDAYVPDRPGPLPGVVVLHGGRWVSGSKSDTRRQCNILKQAGYTAMSLDYTLATRWRSAYPAAVDDVIRFIYWCRSQLRFKLTPESRIGLLGGSAGGTIAHEVGMRAGEDLKPASIASMSGVQDLLAAARVGKGIRYYIGCPPTECPTTWTEASPVESAGSAQPATLLMNSTNEVVPVKDPRSYHQRLRYLGAPSILKLYEGRRHGSMLIDVAKEDFLAFFALTLKWGS